MSWSWKAASDPSPSPPSIIRIPRPRSPTPHAEHRTPRSQDPKPLTLTFGSGGRLNIAPRTQTPFDFTRYPQETPFIDTQNNTPDMSQQTPTMNDIMSLLQELRDSNATLRHEAVEQAQCIEELQNAAPRP